MNCSRLSANSSGVSPTSISRTLTLYIPTGPNQNAPLPPNFNAPATINGVTFPALFTTPITVSRGQVSKYLIPWDKLDIGPRMGFAYNVQDKTVIRGFYGIFYGGEENQGGNPNRGESAPFNESPQLNRPDGVNHFQPDPLMANGSPIGGISVGFPVNVFNWLPCFIAPVPRSGSGLRQSYGAGMEPLRSA